MKVKIAVLCTVTFTLLCLVACSPATKQVSMKVPCDDFFEQQRISKQIEVLAGGSLAVTLCSNPTTGFHWSDSAHISDQTVLRQTNYKFVPSEETRQRLLGGADEGLNNTKLNWAITSRKQICKFPGYDISYDADGEEVWTFEALKKGTSTVSMKYSRLWESIEKEEWEYSRPWDGGEKGEWTFTLTVTVK